MNRKISLLTIFHLCLIGFVVSNISVAHAQTKSNKVIYNVGNPPSPSAGVSPSLGNAPPPPADIRQGIIDQFGITMNGFDQAHLQLAWEKFWEIAPTKYISLIRGSKIIALGYTGGSRQVGCFGGATSVELVQYNGQYFKFILTHELGHVIRNCNPRNVTKYDDHVNAVSKEGAVSYYGGNATKCTGSDNYSEDYADMITYYVNNLAGYATAICDPNQSPPNPYYKLSPRKELHYQVVSQVL